MRRFTRIALAAVFVSIAVAPHASAQQELTYSLFERYLVRGDQRAREELVERFMPLARQLARRYHRAEEPFESSNSTGPSIP